MLKIATFLGVMFGLYILTKILFVTIRASLKKCSHPEAVSTVEKSFLAPVFLLFFIITADIAIPFISIPDNIQNSVSKIIYVLLILDLSWIAINAVGFFKKIILKSKSDTEDDGFKYRKVATQVGFISRIIIFIITCATIIALLMGFESSKQLWTSLLASAGLASIIIGFAAQKTISDFLAGFQVAFTQPLRLNDIVSINGQTGKVEEITLTYIVLRTWDIKTIIVPISQILNTQFQNLTRNSNKVLTYFSLFLDYSVPIDDLRREFANILSQTELWDKTTSSVTVIGTDSKTIEIRFTASVQNVSDSSSLECYLREKLIDYIQEKYPNSLPKVRTNS